MNLVRIITELREEKSRLDEAIVVVERLALGSGHKRRGRPPKWMSEARKGPQSVGRARQSAKAV